MISKYGYVFSQKKLEQLNVGKIKAYFSTNTTLQHSTSATVHTE